MQIPKKAFTHAGRFHADDVFCAALLRYLRPDIKIERGFEVPPNYAGLVFDIGDGAFDHHARSSPVRDNGVPYAAFGLLWREVGAQILGAKDAKRFDEGFVQPLDQDDNTGCGNQLAGIIAAYNPLWDAQKNEEECFEEAIQLALTILEKKFEVFFAVQRAYTEVDAALAQQKNGIVELRRFAPWKQRLIPSKARFVVFPSQRGGWCAQAIAAGFGTQELKVPFPQEWAGAPEADLPSISGIETLRFCHTGRFLVATGTREDAWAACEAAVEAQR